jgi:Asp-tRNA(Asn)/Glu-tRNA(Gln) amidotransferase A subunit family amidase
VRRLRHDIDLAERVDAFVARFGRLQDTVADKLLPALLQAKAESVGPALDNLNKAERFGWLASVDEWLVVRKLRNRMIHEYVKDPAELAQALQAAHDFVPLLVNTAQRMRQAA